MAASEPIFNEATAIRKAWRAGKRCVEINGRKFNIRKKVTTPTAVIGGEQKKLKESWLIATPADHHKVPVYNVELVYMGNLRSKVAEPVK